MILSAGLVVLARRSRARRGGEMATTNPLAPDPRGLTTKGWITTGIAIAIVFIAYVLVAIFYNAEGGITVDGPGQAVGSGELMVSVEPLSMDAVGDNATIRLVFEVQDGTLMSADGRLAKSIRATISSPDGSQEYKFPVGTLLGRAEAVIGTNGEAATYPFDRHDAALALIIDTYERASDGTLTSLGGVSFDTRATGGVNGWDVDVVLPDTVSDAAFIGLEFHRAFSTQVFAVVMIALGLILASLALFVGILVATNRRRMEVALLPWTAGLLFALPLLRTYLPNSPPIGASIDIYVYLWVMAMAISASVLVIITWASPKRAELAVQAQGTPNAP